ncbi:uncharacterized protein [Watersipora subatra]|uniref:uncharacterized protein n=1 Tax=Watersipora subatra TaxID=2589382 RepID=UPI00355B1784
MQSFVERNLNKLHHKSADEKIWPQFLKFLACFFLLCVIPYLHIGVFGYLVWPGKRPVNPLDCECTCFDTVFRGHYEHPPCSKYKHWYFNATSNAFKIWCLVVFGLMLAYECFKHILSCLMDKDIRYSMTILFISTIYPHYYSWWNYFNYYNEQFYDQWYHQLYFTISEIISSGIIIYLVRASHKLETFHILAVFAINMSHVIIGGFDQFIINILYSHGSRPQVARDFGLLVPDILAITVLGYETRRLLFTRRIPLKDLFYREELLLCFLVTSAMVLFGNSL